MVFIFDYNTSYFCSPSKQFVHYWMANGVGRKCSVWMRDMQICSLSTGASMPGSRSIKSDRRLATGSTTLSLTMSSWDRRFTYAWKVRCIVHAFNKSMDNVCLGVSKATFCTTSCLSSTFEFTGSAIYLESRRCKLKCLPIYMWCLRVVFSNSRLAEI